MSNLVTGPVGAFAAGIVLAATAALFFRREAWLSTKIILQFLLTIALPIFLVLSVPLFALAQMAEVDSRIWQAVVAGAVIATGWLTTAIFAEIGKRRDRREKTRDYHRAIFSEIGTNLTYIESPEAMRAHADGIAARMRGDESFVPFIPREDNDALFRAITQEIQILPRKTIDPIVAYYSQVRAIGALIDDMRSPEFRSLSVNRRIAMYEDYIQMKLNAQALGDHALGKIDLFENGSIRADRVRSRMVNTPDADLSDRSGE